MNKGEMVVTMAEVLDLPTKASKTVVEAFSNIVKSSLLAGEEVTIPGVGKLKISVRPARKGRNPSTGATIDIPEKRVVKFSPTADFKAEVSPVTT